MKVLVDTSVWSLALRRNRSVEDSFVRELRELVAELRVEMIGPVRQEFLSKVRSDQDFSILREHLRVFPDLILESADYELAAEFFNRCRTNGIQGSNTDFLICAVAERRRLPILTTERDFQLYQRHIPVRLHQPRSSE